MTRYRERAIMYNYLDVMAKAAYKMFDEIERIPMPDDSESIRAWKDERETADWVLTKIFDKLEELDKEEL